MLLIEKVTVLLDTYFNVFCLFYYYFILMNKFGCRFYRELREYVRRLYKCKNASVRLMVQVAIILQACTHSKFDGLRLLIVLRLFIVKSDRSVTNTCNSVGEAVARFARFAHRSACQIVFSKYETVHAIKVTRIIAVEIMTLCDGRILNCDHAHVKHEHNRSAVIHIILLHPQYIPTITNDMLSTVALDTDWIKIWTLTCAFVLRNSGQTFEDVWKIQLRSFPEHMIIQCTYNSL